MSPESPVNELMHLIYASTSTEPLSAGRLSDILRVSRQNNEGVGVTGMLLHIDGSFFQVLEGPGTRVEEVFSRISKDPRHKNVVTIIRERIHRRAFGEWSMGFAEMQPSDVVDATGANDFFTDARCLDALDAGRAKKLLAAFRNRRWRTAGAALATDARR